MRARTLINLLKWTLLAALLPALGLALDEPDRLRELLRYPPPMPTVMDPSPSLVAIVIAWLVAIALLLWWRSGRVPLAEYHRVPGEEVAPGDLPRRFPRWGWVAIAFLAVAWVLAWTRFEWMAPVQRFTFIPLWFGYILVANAVAVRVRGFCPLQTKTRLFAALFVASAGYWWFFEYLNRFVLNWVYPRLLVTPSLEYVIHGSLSFSTVLPAVMSTVAIFYGFPREQARLSRGPRIDVTGAGGWWVVGVAGMVAIGAWPQGAFPLVWIAPGALWLAIDERARAAYTVELTFGDWHRWITWPLAALVCGFFWEMWNFLSDQKWFYAVPYFEAAHVFEMPITGYLGYLPFGMLCAFAIDVVRTIGTGHAGDPTMPSPAPLRESRSTPPA